MAKNDDALIHISDIPLAVALLSRLPVRVAETSRGAKAAWAYPLVGLIVGGLSALMGLLALGLGLPTLLVALLSLSMLVVLTGAMHEDGLADTADGLWGGWDRAARLQIMKDSHIGSYGVIALFLVQSARWGALWVLYDTNVAHAIAALIASSILSRATMPALMAILPHARADGLSRNVGSVSTATAGLGAALAATLALLLLGGSCFQAIVWAILVTVVIGAIARTKIGGQTGDILGATQQIAEVAVLLSLVP
ncbi:adenosylcobinamide-GDP ribazoletransferase [Roseovarius litorisediminis]|nr:adenosylcobinamide-GDP ribazoletransferase [Roseovarius litorisediminis]